MKDFFIIMGETILFASTLASIFLIFIALGA